jgi:D-beta-D-heptose 7-phosphate kinase/D-beta-D-heptose 1-phosphate adenosyltransferase
MKTVFVNGCFDVLHVGHIRLLEFAKSQGDLLIVALDTDEKVKKAKGHDRPYNTLEVRKEVIESIKHVDLVLDFDSDDALINLFNTLKPDVRVLGSDWQGKKIVGEDCIKDVKYFRRVDGYSTTKILQNSSSR